MIWLSTKFFSWSVRWQWKKMGFNTTHINFRIFCCCLKYRWFFFFFFFTLKYGNLMGFFFFLIQMMSNWKNSPEKKESSAFQVMWIHKALFTKYALHNYWQRDMRTLCALIFFSIELSMFLSLHTTTKNTEIMRALPCPIFHQYKRHKHS